MVILPLPTHSTLPDVPTSTGDDHLQYWADTTIGIRAKNYSTTGTVDVGKLIVRKASDATVEFIDNAGTHIFKYDTGNTQYEFDDDLVIDRSSPTSGMLISSNQLVVLGGSLFLNAGIGGVIDIGSDWTAAGQTCEDLGSITTGDWNGGTIDGTIIGATVAANGTFATAAAATFTDGTAQLTEGLLTQLERVSFFATGTEFITSNASDTLQLNAATLIDMKADVNIDGGTIDDVTISTDLTWNSDQTHTEVFPVVNGDFATDTDWTKGTGWAIGGGTANFTGAGQTDSILEPTVALTPVVGVGYEVTFTITASANKGDTIKAKLGGVESEAFATSDAPITHTVCIIATTTGNLQFLASDNGASDFSIDNVSIIQFNAVTAAFKLKAGTELGTDFLPDTDATYDLGNDTKAFKRLYISDDKITGYALPDFRGLVVNGYAEGDIYVGVDNVTPGFYVQKTVLAGSTVSDNSEDFTNLYQGNSTFRHINMMFAIERVDSGANANNIIIGGGASLTEPCDLTWLGNADADSVRFRMDVGSTFFGIDTSNGAYDIRLGTPASDYTQISSVGNITQVGTGRTLESEKYKLTAIGGFAIRLTNKTGSNTVQGQIVKPDTANEDAVILIVASDQEIIGVFLDAGVADGSEAWVVVSGIADVLIDAGGCTRGDRLISSSATVASAEFWNVGGAVATHFQELGHCIETRVGAGLARGILHFN